MRAKVVDSDPAWVLEIVSFVSDKENEHIFLKNKDLLRDLYLEYMRDGMQPKDALLKAKKVILSFNKK